ncbi:MAG: heavy metal sensor histidine kinase [Burkholderiales bacterium]|nr:heavy metal sensor histidine kinase [Burkholderiales bacterium]
MTLQRASIAVRLTFGLGLVALLIFGATATWLQRALRAQLEAADAAALRGKASVVHHFVEEAARSGDRAALFHHLDDLGIGHDGLHLWLLSAGGESIYGKQAPTPQPAGRGRVGMPAIEVDVLTQALPASSPWPGGMVRVAMAAQRREDLLQTHLATVGVVCAFGVVATVVLSWMVTRRCLRIVTRLSDEAGSITPQALRARLTEPPPRVELAGLVRAFNRALDRLEGAYGQVRSFNANVAHELRTPLASLITGTQVALSTPASCEELRATMASNLEELELLNAIVNDMLFLSRADRGDRAEGLEEVHLDEEGDKVIGYCEALLHEARVQAERVGDARVICNGPLVRRAIVNLLTNAIRYTAPGGKIGIRIDRCDGGVQVGVDNPGEPISPDVREQMFDRFFRADALRGAVPPGRGLGLAIVAAVARMHGGTVFAIRSGTNNRVGFTLPLGHDAAAFEARRDRDA